MERLRHYRFTPYLKGMGPRFSLTTYYTGRSDSMGKAVIAYRLCMNGKPLFTGNDFHCSPLHCVDDDETAKGLMGFLTLRPGDTDDDYFAEYTPEQLEYCNQHAEALSCEIGDRFGWD